MARAATAGELALLRSDNQSTKLKAYVYNPTQVMSGRIESIPTKNDKVTSVRIKNVDGTWTDIDGMTVLVGTSAGAADVGIVRARSFSSYDPQTLYIGETSDIVWAVDQYITVLPEFSLWAKPLTMLAGVWNLEGETVYTDQNKLFNPLPVLGPLVYVGKLAAGTATILPDASASWLPGGTITAYSWSAPGGTVTNGTTATPTITYTTAGHYYIKCTVTGNNGKTFIGFRAVVIEGTGITAGYEDVRLELCSGDTESGGWTFSLSVYESATASGLIRDRALCVVVADDTYGVTAQSIGYVTGQERVICAGWIDGESIANYPQFGTVQFTARGPSGWAAACSAWPMSIMHSDADPEDWMHIKDLDLQKAQWFWAMWRSTAARFMDVHPLDSTYNVNIFDASSGSNDLWAQCKIPAEKIGGLIACDRYGRMFFEADPQLIVPANRGTIPVVMEVTKEDWREEISIERRLAKPIALLETGSITKVGSDWLAVLSRAPGNAMHRTGGVKSRFNMAFTSQGHSNIIAGLLAGKENNPWQNVRVPLGANNRLIDIVPIQYLTLTIAAADNPRGVAWTNQRLIPRSVEIVHKLPAGVILTDVACEVETLAESSVTLEPPSVPEINLPDMPDIIDYPIVPTGTFFPYEEFIPDEEEPDPESVCMTTLTAPETPKVNMHIHGVIDTERRVTARYRFGLRSTSHINPTRYSIRGRFQDFVGNKWVDTALDDFYTVSVLCDDGSVITGVKDAVSDPFVRTGTLGVPGSAGKNAREFRIEWAETLIYNPDALNFSMAGNAQDVTGTQDWWRVGNGIKAQWKDMQFWWGYPNVGRTPVITPVTTEDWRNRLLKVHIEFWRVDGSFLSRPFGGNGGIRYDNTARLGVGDTDWLTMPSLGGNIMPREGDGYWYNTGYGAYGIAGIGANCWKYDYPGWSDYTYSDPFNLYIEVKFAPTKRIIFDYVYLWNICKATS